MEFSWEWYRSELETLYVVENMSLQKVMKEMRERHGFQAR
jgi:hypothetical protein